MKPAIPILILLAIGVIVWVTWPRSTPPNRFEETRQRIEALNAHLEKTRSEMQTSVDAYKPKELHRNDDLGTDAVKVLKGNPGVAEVTGNQTRKPTGRIINILDYLYVSKEDYATESVGDRQEATELLHQEFLLEVELVQVEQMTLLQCRAKYHELETA